MGLHAEEPEGCLKGLGVSRETLRNWVRTHRALDGEESAATNTNTSTKDGRTMAKSGHA
ncbi:hypothetical protein [Streptomyces marianii]|uniref:hypothetical protein n=1 Tax=Streptomyces marianii TaxID=1817406 RepID=UPI00148624EF|nr:hypothetical protein [Streptomyces marianii]